MAKMSQEDFDSCFKGTIVEHEGEIYHVDRSAPGEKVLLHRLKDGQEVVVKSWNKEDYSVKNLRLGMMNSGEHAIWCSRDPLRVYKGGFSSQNCSFKILTTRGPVHTRMDLRSIHFYNMLVGKYPSFEEAVRRVKDFGGAVAFDRQFCIDEERNIYHKTQMVGRLPRFCTKPAHIELFKQFTFLKELLDIQGV